MPTTRNNKSGIRENRRVANGSSNTSTVAGAHRMPAEWAPHESTWLAWPQFRGDWPGKFDPIPWVYAEIIRNLARHESVNLVVQSEREEKRVAAVLERADALSDNVCFHRWPTDRVWTR